MYNKNPEIVSDEDFYDNLFGIKLKGLFNKENREARKERRTARKSDRKANRSKDGSGFKKFLSGLGSTVSTGTDIYSSLKSAGGKSKNFPADQAQAPKNNNSVYFIIGGVLFIVIIVTVIISVKK